MKSAPRVEAGVVVGNVFAKYESKNPFVHGLVAHFERSLFELLATIGPARSILEVGCGEGYITSTLAKHFPDATVLGTDVSHTIIAEARARYPGIEFRPCSIYDAATLGEWDLVVACEVFEHLDHPARAMQAVNAACSGHVLLSVPREPLWRVLNLARGRYWSALGNTPGHVQHWNGRSFRRFVSTHLDIVATRSPLPWTQVLARPRPQAGP